jgi:hypothetical protein
MTMLRPSKLTVRIIKRTLGDHYLDFMNANNPNGYLPDEDKEIDESSLSGVLITTAISPSITVIEGRTKASTIHRLSWNRITKNDARNYVAKALGYHNWAQAKQSAVDGVIGNLRLSKREAATDIHASAKSGVNFENWPIDKPLPPGFVAKNVIGGIPQTRHDRVVHTQSVSWQPARLSYQAFRELVDILVEHNAAAGRRLKNWLFDQNRNVLPGTTLIWAEYKDSGMYIPYNAFRQLTLKFRKLGGFGAMFRIQPDHPAIQDFTRYRRLIAERETQEQDD